MYLVISKKEKHIKGQKKGEPWNGGNGGGEERKTTLRPNRNPRKKTHKYGER